MKCETVKKLFPDFLMMETDNKTTGKIEDHISECEECRRELETSGAMWTKLEVMPVEFPSEHLKNDFYKMLDEEIRKEKLDVEDKGFLGEMMSYLFSRQRLLSPAAILLLIISGFLAGVFVTSGKLSNSGILHEGLKRAGTVNVMTTDQAGIINILNAYEDLKTGSWTESGTLHRKKDPADMSLFEVFTEAALSFTEYFEKIINL